MELKKGYKQTEIGVIPEDWEVIPISSVCTLINGRGFKPFEWKTKGLPIIRIQNLNGSNDFNYYQGYYDKKIEINNGQLLFAWSGSRGTSFGPHVWNGERGLLNYHTWKVVIDERKIDNNFFLYSLKQLTKFIEDKAHGASALVHTQKWEMEGFEFSCPTRREEQTAIATVLSDTDNLLQALQKKIAKKRLIKQGAMQELLKPKEGWEVKTLGEVFHISAGGDLRSEEFSKIKTPINPFPIYSNAHTKKGLYGFCKTFDYEPSAITISARGGIGYTVSRTECFAAIGRLLVLKPIKGIDCKFIEEFIKVNIEFSSESTGVPQLTAPQVSKYSISFPKHEEQTRIATILSDMDTEIENLEKKLAKYKQVKQGLMQNLLTGKVRLV